MPREVVKHRTQVQLSTWVFRHSMEDARVVKEVTGKMIADQVREALFMYYTMMREQGVLPARAGEPAWELWQALPAAVRGALLGYTTDLLREGRLPPEDRKGSLGAQDVFAAKVREALEKHYLGKLEEVREQGLEEETVQRSEPVSSQS